MYNKFIDFLHKFYHWVENGIKVVFGENVQYAFIYFLRVGKFLHLKNPSDLNEKMFWLARYWRNPLITLCSDKYTVRHYLTEKGCADILNDLYGAYDNAEDINFDALPAKFVLKCNHGSRMNIFCEDKNALDKEKAKMKLNGWLRFQYGRGIEWQYKPINRKIVAEKYLESKDGQMIEYQIFCFNGKPEFFLVRNDLRKNCVDAMSEQYAISYTIGWERIYMRKDEEQFNIDLPKPKNYQKMIDYAIRLSQDFPQVRVDFYEIDDKLVFGELTFSSNGGIQSNYKKEYIKSVGEKLTLPQKYNS